MDFYYSHLHLTIKSDADITQDAEDALRSLLPRTAKVEANNIVHGVNVKLGTMLDATVIPKGKKWDVIVAGYKQDIPLDTQGASLEYIAQILKDIARQGKKWFLENDPDGDRW